MVFFIPLLVLYLTSDKRQEIFPASLEIFIREYVFEGVFSRFVEVVHVELANEGMDVTMPEERGQYFLLESLNIPDGEFLTRRKPLDNVLKGRILNKRRVTSRISYVFLMKRATQCSIISDFIDFLLLRFYYLNYW